MMSKKRFYKKKQKTKNGVVVKLFFFFKKSIRVALKLHVRATTDHAIRRLNRARKSDGMTRRVELQTGATERHQNRAGARRAHGKSRQGSSRLGETVPRFSFPPYRPWKPSVERGMKRFPKKSVA